MSSDAEKIRETYLAMLKTAVDEARLGLAEGGIPIGAALFDREGNLLGRGHNRRVQEGDPSAHPFAKPAASVPTATKSW